MSSSLILIAVLLICDITALNAYSYSAVSHSTRSNSIRSSSIISTSSTKLNAYAAPFGTPEKLQEMVDMAILGLTKKKKLSLLGSTGSIGTQTLDICRERPEQFECVAMAAGNNLELLSKQIAEFKPKMVSIRESSQVDNLIAMLVSLGVAQKDMPDFRHGDQGIIDVSTHPDVDTVVTGIVGCAGLLPTVAAIKAGKDIALANKETLIAGGPVVVPLLAKHKVNMLPADSEHSAIFQSLQGFPPGALKRIILTASGGAFRDWDKADLAKVKVADGTFVIIILYDTSDMIILLL